VPTIKQRKTAQKTLENIGNDKPATKGQILAQVGYSKAIQENPQMVYNTRGYKEAEKEILMKYRIDKNSRLERLADIFWDKDKRSAISANQEISKMLGDYQEKEGKMIGFFKDL
jgi:hypothetical protein